MSEAILISFATLLVGWVLGRLSLSIDKSYDRRASRNRLIFHLIELFEEIAKRKILDDVILSYAESKHKLSALRSHARRAVPDEAGHSTEHFHAVIRDTASYDPLFAQEINSTLLPAKLLDERLMTTKLDEDEFQIMLVVLTKMDSAIMKRLQLLSEEIAAKNSLFQKKRIRAFFSHRHQTLKESLDAQQKLREALKSATTDTERSV